TSGQGGSGMKRIGVLALALLAIILTIFLRRGLQPANAQGAEGNGWLEGTIVTEKGRPASSTPQGNGLAIPIRPQQGVGIRTENDPSKGGFYTFRGIRPGVYEVFVDQSTYPTNGFEKVLHLRPVHIIGVNVEPGKR